MLHIKTESGFECDIDEDVNDDAELLEETVELEKGNVMLLPSLLTRILGEENKKALYEHLRNENGRVPFSALSDEIKSIFLSIGETKKK